MKTDQTTRLNEALAGVRQALEADGYQLVCEPPSADGLVVRILATDNACAECLSPPAVIKAIIGQALRDAGMADLAPGLSLEYPTEALAAPQIQALSAQRQEFLDEATAAEYCIEQGWTDGLPVVPPTPERVGAMLAASDLAPDAVLGRIPERRITIRAEQVAINAVMAGCLPAYFPVVLAGVKALLEPAMGLHGPWASTAGSGFLVIVNGPYARRIGLRNGENLFGPGARANATIGRAIRLLLINAGGNSLDRTTLGHSGKYTYCIAEQEDQGWEPLHTLRGFDSGDSTVTVMAASAPNQISDHLSSKGEDLLSTIANRMVANAIGGVNRQMGVIIAPEHRRTLQAAGWSKADVRQRIWEKAGTNVMSSPEDLLVLTAGGEAGRFSAVVSGWGKSQDCSAVTVKITGVEG